MAKLDFLNHEISSIHSAAFLLGAAGLLSRILGVFRDRLLAGSFGAGRELDVYYSAFQVPDFMAIVFLLGAGSAAILPIFQEELVRDKDASRRLVSHLSLLFILGSFLLALAAFFAAPLLMRLVAPGFSSADLFTATLLTRIMLISPILLGLSSIFSSVVQAFERFIAYALAPILYNIGIIVGILFFVPIFGLIGLAWGVVLGALLHLAVQFISVARLGFAPRLETHSKDFFLSWRNTLFSGKIWRVIGLAFPRVLSVSVSHITILVLIAFASTFAEGSISVFQLARNLFFVPIGIFGVSYAVAIFPRLSRSYINRDSKEFYRELFLGIRTIIFWIAPSTVIFIVLRAHIVRVALGAGLFSWEDTRLSAAVLAAFSLAMFAEALVSLLIKGFYALGNTWAPFFINIGASVTSIGFAFYFASVLNGQSAWSSAITSIFRISDLPNPEVLGLALGFSLGLAFNIFFLYRSLLRFAGKAFKERKLFPAVALAKIVMGAIVAGVAAYAARVSFSETLPLITFIQVFWQGVVSGLVGFAVYFGVLVLLKNEEVHSIWQSLGHRFFRLKTLPEHWDGETHLPHQP